MIIPFNNKKRGEENDSVGKVNSFIKSIDLDDFVKSYSKWLKMNVDEKIKLENSLNKARLKNIRKGD